VKNHLLTRTLVALGLAIAVVGTSQSAVFASITALPDCAYGNVLTPFADYSDWRSTLLDTTFKVSREYVPPHLVSVSEARIAGTGKVRKLVLQDLYSLKYAAWKAGNPIAVASAYRSYYNQKLTFSYWVDRYSYDQALKTSARPGHSEHQLGTTLDFKTKHGPDPWNVADWAKTPAGAWMAANAWRYGFIMSYPKGERSVTCYAYEPWHYRYFGRDVAAKIHNSGLTARQWLWRHGYGIAPSGS
jgi:D-alanyl-D-alanine carboxypeptidase